MYRFYTICLLNLPYTNDSPSSAFIRTGTADQHNTKAHSGTELSITISDCIEQVIFARQL